MCQNGDCKCSDQTMTDALLACDMTGDLLEQESQLDEAMQLFYDHLPDDLNPAFRRWVDMTCFLPARSVLHPAKSVHVMFMSNSCRARNEDFRTAKMKSLQEHIHVLQSLLCKAEPGSCAKNEPRTPLRKRRATDTACVDV